MNKVYLDNCCFSRQFDIKTHPKVRAEAAKIKRIISNRVKDGYVIIGSGAVTTEIGNIRDDKRRRAVKKLYFRTIADEVNISAQIIERARELELKGLGTMDARHLAAAEAVGADFLLTTDADFIRKCKNRNLTTLKVINPLDF